MKTFLVEQGADTSLVNSGGYGNDSFTEYYVDVFGLGYNGLLVPVELVLICVGVMSKTMNYIK